MKRSVGVATEMAFVSGCTWGRSDESSEEVAVGLVLLGACLPTFLRQRLLVKSDSTCDSAGRGRRGAMSDPRTRQRLVATCEAPTNLKFLFVCCTEYTLVDPDTLASGLASDTGEIAKGCPGTETRGRESVSLANE
ncbi:hypothetical protein BDW02DRAFT_24549 [Decorospora gaudefroyi]|uniref:Uncharacterized protein n=1 Tax=Decorospora gaudefroyi TaxID=184978 RepID=A0A6A5K445_9PLEO|nr:hypothetical protein BDW02DRAFT_24549 [Decorospora gaudefroyi]